MNEYNKLSGINTHNKTTREHNKQEFMTSKLNFDFPSDFQMPKDSSKLAAMPINIHAKSSRYFMQNKSRQNSRINGSKERFNQDQERFVLTPTRVVSRQP